MAHFEMNEALKKFYFRNALAEYKTLEHLAGLGPTGNFPEGKLTEHDEGEIAFAVGSKDGKVIINFNSQITWLGMMPEQAIDLGRLLKKHGKKLLKGGS